MTLAKAVKSRIIALVVGVKSEGCLLVCGHGSWVLCPPVLALADSSQGWTRDGMLKLGSENEPYLQVVSGSLKSCLLLVLSFIPTPLVSHD